MFAAAATNQMTTNATVAVIIDEMFELARSFATHVQGVLVKGVDFCRDLKLKATFTSLCEQKSLSQS
jgi:hypothetical protein